jgi:predicted dehydrogenase
LWPPPTPDHWHALPAIAAMQAGADVYCQKPISVDVVEGQAMLAAARKYNRVVQIGTQRRSTPHLAEARERFVRSGKLGKVGLIEIYSYYGQRPRTDADTAPPANLDYEFWTGPAPMRPYNPILHPRSWRAFMEYGNGTIGDMGVHMLDMSRWMLGLGWPKRISSTGGILVNKSGRANISDTQTATFEFDDCQMIWTHRHWGAPPDPKYIWGATLYGDQGTLKAGVFSYDFFPAKGDPVHKDVTYELDKFPEDNTEPQIEKHVAPAIRYHMQDFLHAIDARTRPVADIEEGYISSSCCILGNVAMKLGRTLEWDAKNGRVKGDDEANALLRRQYRAPWVHPEPEKV